MKRHFRLTGLFVHSRFDRMSAPLTSETADASRNAIGVHARDGDADADAVSAHCYHCGLPNSRSPHWRAFLNGASRSFCCAGCRGVAQTIHAAGLDGFYLRRTESADTPVPAEALQDEWSHWDHPDAQAGFVRPAAEGRADVSLLLEGIHCGACIWLIESWLGRQPGIAAASVNFATRRALVTLDPGRATLSQVLRAVAAIGYRAHPYDPARREALARRESRTMLLRMAVALLAMMQVMMFAVPTYITVDGVEPAHQRLLEWASLTLTLPSILYCAAPFFRGAWRDLTHLRPGMDVPVALGLGAAFLASAWATFSGEGPVYYDSVTMFIALLLAARYVEQIARRRAGDAIESVARAGPATAERLPAWPASRETATVAAVSLAAGDFVLVRPGASIPADGSVVEGRASVEEAILTGESMPRTRTVGDPVLAGSVVRDGALVLAVTAAGAATRLASIERLVERAGSERPRLARIADRVARWFVAALLLVAALTAVAWWQFDPARALAVTFAVLVVSCPCALSLATPAALAAAAGALGRRRVVIARADALESLARVTHVVFDKTGTLTTGRLSLVDTVVSGDTTSGAAIALAATLEAVSEHPIARAFTEAAGERPGIPVQSPSVVPGHGVEGIVAGRIVRLGTLPFAAALSGGTSPRHPIAGAHPSATIVTMGDARGIIASFVLADALRPDANALIERLRTLGVVPMLLSGDRASTVAATAAALGIGDAHGDAAPEDKRAAIAELQARGAVVAMVGDGVNDAPSLAQAQVSISLGTATPLAQWTADVVVLADALVGIADAIAHARRTLAIVRENLGWAFAYNLVAIPAAALGFVTPLVAALGMSLSSLVVVGNALRLARIRGEPLSAHAGAVPSRGTMRHDAA